MHQGMTICMMLSNYMCKFCMGTTTSEYLRLNLLKKVKGDYIHLTESDSQEEDQGMSCRLVYM